MDRDTLQFFFDNFGMTLTLFVVGGLFVFSAIYAVIIHYFAEPNTPISLFWGLVTYTKRVESTKKFKAVKVVQPDFEFLWRLMSDPEDWINLDISGVSEGTANRILDGPFHSVCGHDLSYYESSRHGGRDHGYCIRNLCYCSDHELIPGAKVIVRFKLKQMALKLIKEAHIKGKKIRDNMEV